jgi:GAF domain-containing protein
MPVDQRALASTLQALLSTLDPPAGMDGQDLVQYLDRVLRAAQEVLGVDGVGLMLLDERDRLRVVGASDAAGAALERGQQQIGAGPAIDCIRAAATVTVVDVADRVDYAALWHWLRRESGVADVPRAVLSAPVRVEGTTVGTLNALRLRPERWTAEHAQAVEAYAGIIGVLLRLGARRSDGRIRAPGQTERE